MANTRLREALDSSALSPRDVASQLGVDPKTVERWITQNRTPYPRYRRQVAELLGQGEGYLWPDLLASGRGGTAGQGSVAEMVQLYARRAHVPADVWSRLLHGASRQIDVLVYSGLFLPEQQPALVDQLCQKVSKGAAVRLLMANPEGSHVLGRGVEEGIGDAIVAKVRNALSFYQHHIDHGCIQLRLHDTTLYNSIYRFDDEMLVNAHVLGLPAAHAPVMHLRRTDGGELFGLYAGSFDRIWSHAEPDRKADPMAAPETV